MTRNWPPSFRTVAQAAFLRLEQGIDASGKLAGRVESIDESRSKWRMLLEKISTLAARLESSAVFADYVASIEEQLRLAAQERRRTTQEAVEGVVSPEDLRLVAEVGAAVERAKGRMQNSVESANVVVRRMEALRSLRDETRALVQAIHDARPEA